MQYFVNGISNGFHGGGICFIVQNAAFLQMISFKNPFQNLPVLRYGTESERISVINQNTAHKINKARRSLCGVA